MVRAYPLSKRKSAELKTEITTLKGLEALALSIRRGGEDKKWRELANLLTEIFTPAAIASELGEGEQATLTPARMRSHMTSETGSNPNTSSMRNR
jgi:hypothetical protein